MIWSKAVSALPERVTAALLETRPAAPRMSTTRILFPSPFIRISGTDAAAVDLSGTRSNPLLLGQARFRSTGSI